MHHQTLRIAIHKTKLLYLVLFQLSLFFDFLLATCSALTEETFVSGTYGPSCSAEGPPRQGTGDGAVGVDEERRFGRLRSARAILWKHLRPFQAKACGFYFILLYLFEGLIVFS